MKFSFLKIHIFIHSCESLSAWKMNWKSCLNELSERTRQLELDILCGKICMTSNILEKNLEPEGHSFLASSTSRVGEIG